MRLFTTRLNYLVLIILPLQAHASISQTSSLKPHETTKLPLKTTTKSAPKSTGVTVWDYAPDFAKDPIPPYPSLKKPDGSNLTIESVRGAHLFGWKGCTNEEANEIATAYNDFYTLAQQLNVYNKIDWNKQAATDFWGPATGNHRVPDDTRKEIQQIFQAAQQVYSYWWTWQPPWLSWRQLWIEIRCSDSKLGKDSSDPKNFCGDGKKKPDKCPSGKAPVGGGKETLEAFSEPDPDDGRYSRITFCNDFFKLPTFKDAIATGKKLPAAQKTNLEKWNNRARCFFHEVTHLDYFMNAGDSKDAKSPYVSDLEVEYTVKGKTEWHDAYGPYNAKILRNWVDPDPKYSGYFTQRNADNYAFFALATFVESEIGKYPGSPSPGRKKPTAEPRDAITHLEPRLAKGGGSAGGEAAPSGNTPPAPKGEKGAPSGGTPPAKGGEAEKMPVKAGEEGKSPKLRLRGRPAGGSALVQNKRMVGGGTGAPTQSSQDGDLISGPEQDPPDTQYPGCGDKVGKDAAYVASQHASGSQTTSLWPQVTPHTTTIETSLQSKSKPAPHSTPKPERPNPGSPGGPRLDRRLKY